MLTFFVCLLFLFYIYTDAGASLGNVFLSTLKFPLDFQFSPVQIFIVLFPMDIWWGSLIADQHPQTKLSHSPAHMWHAREDAQWLIHMEAGRQKKEICQEKIQKTQTN